MNTTTLLNDGWTFAKSGLEAISPEELLFAPVDLPHDWLIEDTRNLYENSIGWYKRTLPHPGRDRRALLRFDGVYMDSTLYVNGQCAGEWKNGYTSFEYDITDLLTEGDNVLLVRVVHQSPNSRWYSGAGIYRDVWLKTRGPAWVVTDGTYVTVRREGATWRVEVDTELHTEQPVRVSHTLFRDQEPVVGSASPVDAEGQDRVDRQALILSGPALWSPESPHLYRLETRLETPDQTLIEAVTQHIGFRELVFDPDRGLSLNGVHIKLNGVCEHHDLGALGAAFNKTALRRRFRILKEMGVNAVRTSHNPPAPAWMDLADEMGLLVMSEAFDMWERPKTRYDYARFFPEWHERDVASWVRRDRNHPSLLMWSIGNEIYDTHADERGQAITRRLMDLVREHDPRGNAPVTIGSNYMPWENAQRCADIVKLAGYNYAERLYEQHHLEHPDWILYGSETASIVQSRGIYHFPFSKSILADDDEQCSSLGNSPVSYGAKAAEHCVLTERDTPFSLGQFLWTGFDYIGEPTPYHTKNSYYGQIDTATFPKDAYYFYQSAWTDVQTRPMIHILPHWDWNPGQLIDVRVFSNAPRIELRLDGEVVGAFDIDHVHGTQLAGHWRIPFRPGTLEAFACDKEGRVVATCVRRSFGESYALRLRPDKTDLCADGTDLVFVEITTDDREGNPVDNAGNRVDIRVTGAGRLVGLDNGDSTDYDPYKGTSRRLFSGRLMAIIAPTMEAGPIRIEAVSPGLQPAAVELRSQPVPAGQRSGVSVFAYNRELPIQLGQSGEIPLRKIELVAAGGQSLDETRRTAEVRAVLHPADATWRDVSWSVVDAAGIPSNLAIVEAAGQTALVTALGDGAFLLRCTSRNGGPGTRLLSQLEWTVTGLGTAYKDPYGFVSAGLYTRSWGEVSNGNERGVATARGAETRVCVEGIDFGPFGSDTITMPLFALTSEPYAMQIWEGMPGDDGAQMLADVVYQKPSRWNVYQEETFRLSRRLRGITSICFVLHDKVHIKGFTFTRPDRAFSDNPAAEADHLYGDTFTVVDGKVEEIGNNVSLEFGGMAFGPEGATGILIRGHSPIDRNTLHLRFSGPEGDEARSVEFTRSDAYEERVFSIERVTGDRTVTFMFLPGSRFDFDSFRFLR